MVYCNKCGTRNDDTATHCTNCGAPLYTVGEKYPGSDREYYRRMEGECFGIQGAASVVWAIFGIIIILIGLGVFLNVAYGISISNYIWPAILVIIGILIIVGALSTRRRYERSRTQQAA